GGRESQERIAQVLGIPVEAWDRVLGETYPDRFLGRTGDLPETIRRLAALVGAAPDESAVAEVVRLRTEAYLRGVQPRPDAVGVLKSLRDNGFLVGLVSDCSVELPAYWPSSPLAEFVEVTVFSSQT